MNQPIIPIAPTNTMVSIQPLTTVAVTRDATNTDTPLANLPAGASLEGFVINRDAKNNPILRTALGDFVVESTVFLKTGSVVMLRVDPSQASRARIVTVDGMTPEDYAAQNIHGLTRDTIAQTQLQQQPARTPTGTPILQNSSETAEKTPTDHPVLEAVVLHPNFVGPAAPKNSLAALLPTSKDPIPPALAQLPTGTPLKLTVIDVELPPVPISLATIPEVKLPSSLFPALPTQAAEAPAPAIPAATQQAVQTTTPATPPPIPATAGTPPPPLTNNQTPLPTTTPTPNTPIATPLPTTNSAPSLSSVPTNQPAPTTPPITPPPAMSPAPVAPMTATTPATSASPTPIAAPPPAAAGIPSPTPVTNAPTPSPLSTAQQTQPANVALPASGPQPATSAPLPTAPQMPPLSQSPLAAYTSLQPKPPVGQTPPSQPTNTTLQTTSTPSPTTGPIITTARPTSTTSTAVPSSPNMPEFRATVIGHEADGANILQTPFASIKLYTQQPLPSGTILVIHAEKDATAKLPNVPVLPDNLKDITSFTRDWQNLADALSSLQTTNPPLADAVLQRIPSFNAQFTSSVLFFLAAIKGGSVRDWLGERTTKQLEITAPKILAALGADIEKMQQFFAHSPLADWSGLMLPFMFGQEIHQARLYVRNEEEREGATGIKGGGQRFVVECDLSHLGELQFDGFVRGGEKAKSFDLVVRAAHTLPPDISQGIREVFTDTIGGANLAGQLVFQYGSQHFIRPLATATKPSSGGESQPILA